MRRTKRLADLHREATEGERWRAEHPEVIHGLSEIGSQIYNLQAAVESERWAVDTELNPRPAPERSPERSPPTSTADRSSTTVTTGSGCESGVAAELLRVAVVLWIDSRAWRDVTNHLAQAVPVPVAYLGRAQPDRKPSAAMSSHETRSDGPLTLQPTKGNTGNTESDHAVTTSGYRVLRWLPWRFGG